MPMQIKNLAVNLSDDRPLIEIIAKYLRISSKKIANIQIVRKAIDARRRHGSGIKFIYNLEVELIGKEVKIEEKKVPLFFTSHRISGSSPASDRKK